MEAGRSRTSVPLPDRDAVTTTVSSTASDPDPSVADVSNTVLSCAVWASAGVAATSATMDTAIILIRSVPRAVMDEATGPIDRANANDGAGLAGRTRSPATSTPCAAPAARFGNPAK